MKKFSITLHTLLISTLMLTATCLQSMESPAEDSLTSVPYDVLMHIFSYCPIHYCVENEKVEKQVNTKKETEALIRSIQFFLQTRETCKRFLQFLTLETIGNLCKSYNQSDKDFWFQYMNLQIISAYLHMNPPVKDFWLALVDYQITHTTLGTILIHAGADLNIAPDFVEYNVRNNNTELIELFFKHPDLDTPFFFYANTVNQAQSLIDKGVNVHKTDKDGLNVLWSITCCKLIPAELIGLYLKYQVNAEQVYPDSIKHPLDPEPESCLLHACVEGNYPECYENTIEKTLLLLDAIPHMINQINTRGYTPLDIVFLQLENEDKYEDEPGIKFYTNLATLFKERDGLTAQELKQKETNTLMEKDSL